MTTTVITLSEYAPDAVLCTVRLYAALVLETITLGYRPVKIDTMQADIVTVVAANAKPSRWSQTSQTAASTASTASSSTGLRKKVVLEVTCVQIMKATTAAPVSGATRRARRPERWLMSPVVFRDRNVAPCSRQISTRVIPVSSAHGCSTSQNAPGSSWLAFDR